MMDFKVWEPYCNNKTMTDLGLLVTSNTTSPATSTTLTPSTSDSHGQIDGGGDSSDCPTDKNKELTMNLLTFVGGMVIGVIGVMLCTYNCSSWRRKVIVLLSRRGTGGGGSGNGRRGRNERGMGVELVPDGEDEFGGSL